MANSYPILKMENISQVLLFSKYCLTLFFVCLIVLLEKILWIRDAVRMQFLLSHLFKTTLVTQLTKSQRAICFSIFSPFFFLFFFFCLWWSISTSFKIHSKYTEKKHYVVTFLGYIFNRKTWEQNFKYFLFAAI